MYGRHQCHQNQMARRLAYAESLHATGNAQTWMTIAVNKKTSTRENQDGFPLSAKAISRLLERLT